MLWGNTYSWNSEDTGVCLPGDSKFSQADNEDRPSYSVGTLQLVHTRPFVPRPFVPWLDCKFFKIKVHHQTELSVEKKRAWGPGGASEDLAHGFSTGINVIIMEKLLCVCM